MEKKKSGLKDEVKSVKLLLNNKVDVKSLQPGDHIYSRHGLALNSHHGIYIGKEQVIHFITKKPSPKKSKTCSKCGYKNDDGKLGVVKTCLDCFLSEGSRNIVKHSPHLYQYNVSTSWCASRRDGSCSTAIPLPADEVIETAVCFSQDNGFVDYSAFYDDDESFAIYCKTGVANNEREKLKKSRRKKIKKGKEHVSGEAEQEEADEDEEYDDEWLKIE